ncbi:SDR family NAD(P)-dependent oxidoreductase [Mesorhizobium sp. f-mel]
MPTPTWRRRIESGRTPEITGASAGIGRAIVLRLAREGAKVALIARDKPALSQLTVEIEGEGGEALAIAADVSDAPKYSQRPTRSSQHLGPIDGQPLNVMSNDLA